MEICGSCCQTRNKGEFLTLIKASTPYGSGVKSLTVLLNSSFAIPVNKVQSLFIDLLGYKINESTIVNNNITCSKHLEPVESVIKEHLTKAQLGHSDETGVRVVEKLHWLHVFANTLYTFFFVHEKRDKKALEAEQSILPVYCLKAGWVIHDC